MSEAASFLQGSVEAPEPLEDGILSDFGQEGRVCGDWGPGAGWLHRGVGGRGGDPGQGHDGGRGGGSEALGAGVSHTEENSNSDKFDCELGHSSYYSLID